MRAKWFIYSCVAATSLLLPAVAHAQLYTQIARGLFLAGFVPDVTRNPLSKGFDATYSRSFFNDSLNYGISSLTLTGGLTLQGRVYQCPVNGAALSIKSTADPKGTAVPLTYTLTIPRAVEQITVTGNITISTDTKVDQTGYYSVMTSIENRGTVTTTGLKNTTQNIDFNIGPVDQVGNIYLKAIGNVVNRFGGPGDAIAGLPETGPILAAGEMNATSLDSLDSLNLDDPKQLETYVNTVLLQGITQAATDPSIGRTTTMTTLVPEPSTLALLAISGAMTFFGMRRRVSH